MRPTPVAPKKGAFSVLGLALILIFLLFCGAVLFPVFASARAAAATASFRGHLTKSGNAVYLYSLDNDHRLPLVGIGSIAPRSTRSSRTLSTSRKALASPQVMTFMALP